ncbi:MAG: hypothetical protein HFF18_14730 [Oscillospiraceae bacterium]|nr:hypothetical protein [Oscillospiraceae bacterium]
MKSETCRLNHPAGFVLMPPCKPLFGSVYRFLFQFLDRKRQEGKRCYAVANKFLSIYCGTVMAEKLWLHHKQRFPFQFHSGQNTAACFAMPIFMVLSFLDFYAFGP